MSGAELRQEGLLVGRTDTDYEADERRRAAVRIADQIAAEHPDPRDDLMPKLVGRELAKDPEIAAGVLELLDQLGLRKQPRRGK